ncbi:jg11958 [Pararge aegeria aegeria]|uniref:Jg11958 protein n=1 Tax=Pararge aegeria aegeria TaxID=348720 RepID=A0A8S4SD60_9NEOP|nr:jg11958 [Pararge aegeria aegeria]
MVIDCASRISRGKAFQSLTACTVKDRWKKDVFCEGILKISFLAVQRTSPGRPTKFQSCLPAARKQFSIFPLELLKESE